MTEKLVHKHIIGWQEWVGFPELGIKRIKAKIDTGAKTSALHAEDIQIHKTKAGVYRASFFVTPLKSNPRYKAHCHADLIDQRYVRSSNGQRELRTTIATILHIGEYSYPIELTLTNRDSMGFRLLIGRSAIAHNFLIDPHHSFTFGKRK